EATHRQRPYGDVLDGLLVGARDTDAVARLGAGALAGGLGGHQHGAGGTVAPQGDVRLGDVDALPVGTGREEDGVPRLGGVDGLLDRLPGLYTVHGRVRGRRSGTQSRGHD